MIVNLPAGEGNDEEGEGDEDEDGDDEDDDEDDEDDGSDGIVVTGAAGSVRVTGLSATVAIGSAEFANDRLDINTAAGNEAVDASGLAPGVIQLFVDGAPA